MNIHLNWISSSLTKNPCDIIALKNNDGLRLNIGNYFKVHFKATKRV